MDSPDDFDQRRHAAGSPQGRDRGLLRTSRATRWIAVTAVAGAAALGGVYTHLLPGGSASSAPTAPAVQSPAAPSTTAGQSSGHDGEGGDDENGDDGNEGAAPAAQPPAQPPAATQQQPHTTTGAS